MSSDTERDVSREIETYGERIAELESQVTALEENQSTLTRENAALRENLKKTEGDRNQLDVELADAKSTIEDLRKKVGIDALRLCAYVRNMNDAIAYAAKAALEISRDILPADNPGNGELNLTLTHLDKNIAQLRPGSPEDPVLRQKSSVFALFEWFFRFRICLYLFTFRYRCALEEHRQKKQFDQEVRKAVQAETFLLRVGFYITLGLFVLSLLPYVFRL